MVLQRCWSLVGNSLLVGGVTADAGFFQAMPYNLGARLCLEGSGVNCTWAKTDTTFGGGGAFPILQCDETNFDPMPYQSIFWQ